MKKFKVTIIVSVFLTCQSWLCYSFETETHRLLSRQAVLGSAVDDFLKNELNFTNGVNEVLVGKPIIETVAQGSFDEDDGFRYLNHFHNPLRTWNQAGLLGSTLGNSSIIWGQTSGQGFAWQNARDEYFLGLTATTQAGRNDHLSKTFSAIGHLIHLVQDAAQPAHSRNDPHPIFSGFEGCVESVRSESPTLFNSWTSSSTGFIRRF
jgi:hypothetical protein